MKIIIKLIVIKFFCDSIKNSINSIVDIHKNMITNWEEYVFVFRAPFWVYPRKSNSIGIHDYGAYKALFSMKRSERFST